MNVKHIRVVSDLHLEFYFTTPIRHLIKMFLPPDDRDKDAILVLAGDITARLQQLLAFFKEVEPRFYAVVYVPGNHEYYHSDFTTWNEEAREAIEEHTSVDAAINSVNEMQYGRDLRVISATLWADGGRNPLDQMMVGRGLNDFRLIAEGNGLFTVNKMITIHERQKAEITEKLANPFTGKTVVVTHHLPSYSLCHPRFDSRFNGGFASNCESMILNHKPNLWIHGHTHDTMDSMIGETRIVCNPAGYVGENNKTEHNRFETLFVDL